jgi:pyridoxamine 5'-phosphate oxidase
MRRLLFFWSELERQIRIEGVVERTSAEESDTYFDSRPLKSRLAAIASAQSAPIANREALEQHYDAVAKQLRRRPAAPRQLGWFPPGAAPDRVLARQAFAFS